MGAALKLLIGGPRCSTSSLSAWSAVLLEVFVRYSRYVSVLKWLTLSLFAYVATVFVVGMPWVQGRCTHRPAAAVASTSDYVTRRRRGPRHHDQPLPVLLAGRGGGRGGARSSRRRQPLIDAPEQAPGEFDRIRIDTYVGMALSNLVALFIIITTAATLHAHGVTDIQTSAQAAEALRPIAGPFAFALFALGIIGTGLLALPVLAGSAAYALGEALRLARRPGAQGRARAKAFYGAIAVADR